VDAGKPMTSLEVAVIVPLEDPRGDVVEHLRSWTDHQTLERERYQLVAGADGEHPEFERRVAEILEPQDTIVTLPGAALMTLYDAAARAAQARVLVFTEAHCHAEPDCLATVAERFAAEPELDGAMFHHRQGVSGDFGRLSERWFERSHALWEQTPWTRLKIGGAAIRAEAYVRAGGIDPEMDLFAPFFLSARLDQQGGRVEHLEEAVITHVLEEAMGEDLQHSGRYARGECLARAKHDPAFMQRYFGSGDLWERRLSYRPEVSRALIVALVAAARRSPRDAGWLAREVAARLPSGVAGPRPRSAWERALTGLHRRVTDSELLPFERRWQSYISATEHILKAIELEQGSAENGGTATRAGSGVHSAEQLDGVIAGTYGLEGERNRRFRWTEPSALVRLEPPAKGALLRLDTAGLRGAPLGYLHGVYAGALQLPPQLITGDDEALELRLPPEFARAAADSGLVLICRPFIPSRDGSSDRRRLGMPVVELELGAAD
jgi:hypothetical protein